MNSPGAFFCRHLHRQGEEVRAGIDLRGNEGVLVKVAGADQ